MTIGVPKEIKEQAYRVANLPGAHGQTATQALTNVTYRYLEMLADYGIEEACAKNPALIDGINLKNSKVTCKAVAETHGLLFCQIKYRNCRHATGGGAFLEHRRPGHFRDRRGALYLVRASLHQRKIFLPL